MIMFMYKKICITNRHICSTDFIKRIDAILKTDVDMLILREKDLPEEEYIMLANKVIALCRKYNKECILHTFVSAAKALDNKKIHLTMHDFLNLSNNDRNFFEKIGVSTHSVSEALTAQKLNASYITASHIYYTDCKKKLLPKGINYLKEVTKAVDIDVYALGGIHFDNMMECINAGASGICMMSQYMKGELN